jgi:hypothetical protein
MENMASNFFREMYSADANVNAEELLNLFEPRTLAFARSLGMTKSVPHCFNWGTLTDDVTGGGGG